MKVIAVVVVLLLGQSLALQVAPLVRQLNSEVGLNLLNSSNLSRIINGQEAPRNAYPYQVGVEIRVQNENTWCGGSVISEYYVLTAAHCIELATSITVFFGAHDRTNSNETGQLRVSLNKSSFILHAGFNDRLLKNDIALIRMPTKIQYSTYIQPIALPPRALENATLDGSPVVATGWGTTAGSFSFSSKLQFVDAVILRQDVCRRYFPNILLPTNICIDGSKGKGVCQGDSGGPLATTTGERYLVGVASFGTGQGCEANWPSVFTRVSKYLDWISANTGMSMN